MKAFIIVREDGLWIEQRRDRGATHYEAGNKLPPRLWFKEGNARSWLTTYCKGEHISNYTETTPDWETGLTDTVVKLKIIPVEGRTLDRFKVVKVEIIQLEG